LQVTADAPKLPTLRESENDVIQSKVNRKIEPELLGMAEAEAMTCRSRWSWRRDCYSGAVASVKIGRRLFVPIAEVRRVIAECTRPRLRDAK
jgi:hypothetical protein